MAEPKLEEVDRKTGKAPARSIWAFSTGGSKSFA